MISFFDVRSCLDMVHLSVCALLQSEASQAPRMYEGVMYIRHMYHVMYTIACGKMLDTTDGCMSPCGKKQDISSYNACKDDIWAMLPSTW